MSQTDSSSLAAPSPSADPSNVVAIIIRRLVPFLCLLFIVNYLDRTNIAMAKLRMLKDAGLNENIYGRAAALFFVGYFLFEVPSNLILERVGARIWITRIMITWGLISAAMMFVRGPLSFCWLRFLLGVAEAGFFPGIVLYLTYWIPAHRRSAVLAAFLTSTALSGIVGNPLAGALMKLEGVAKLHGWQWLFLLEGIVPVLLGFVTLMLLPDRPRQARWLTGEQKDWIEAELSRESSMNHRAGLRLEWQAQSQSIEYETPIQPCPQHYVAELVQALRDVRLWLLSAIYFMLVMGLYGFIFWLPSIIKSVTAASDLQIGFWSAVPYVIGAAAMVIVGPHSDRHNERRWHVAACALIAAAGVTVVWRCHAMAGVIPALCVAAIGIFASLGPFWALATRFLRGRAAAGGIAIVNSIGALAGFVAPYLIGWIKEKTGGFSGLLVVAVALVCGAALVLCVPRAVDRGETMEPN